MSKSLVVNRFNQQNHYITLPCDDTVATAFAGAMLDGEYVVYKQGAVTGSDVETTSSTVNVMFKNTTSGEKDYMKMLVKSTKSEDEIFQTLIGLTINGILIDEAFILSIRENVHA